VPRACPASSFASLLPAPTPARLRPTSAPCFTCPPHPHPPAQLAVTVFYEDNEAYYSTTFFNKTLTFTQGKTDPLRLYFEYAPYSALGGAFGDCGSEGLPAHRGAGEGCTMRRMHTP